MGVSDRWRKFNYQYLITTVPTQPFLYSISSRVISSIVRRCLENVSVVSQTSKFLHSFFYYLPDSWDFFPLNDHDALLENLPPNKNVESNMILNKILKIFSRLIITGAALWASWWLLCNSFLFRIKWIKIQRGCSNHLSNKIKYIKHKMYFVNKIKKKKECWT